MLNVKPKDRLLRAQELAFKGFWSELKEFIDENPELSKLTDKFGHTLLFSCARYGGGADCIFQLCRLGADPNHQSATGERPLSDAICGGSRYGLGTLPELKALIECGANPELVVDAGMPALHWAIAQCKLEYVRFFLEIGVDVNRTTEDSPPESPLDIARRMYYQDAMDLIQKSLRVGG